VMALPVHEWLPMPETLFSLTLEKPYSGLQNPPTKCH